MDQTKMITRAYNFEIRAENNDKNGDHITGRPIVYNSKTDFSVEPDVNGEINIEIRAWGTSPTPVPPAPAECKYTEYENWQIKFGPDWTWSDNMTKVEDGLFKMEIEWDGTGFNIKSDENPIKQDWFPVEELVIGEEVIAPVIVDVYLKVIDDEHIRIGIGTNPGVGPTDAINIINTEDVPNGAIIKDGKVYIIRNGKIYNLQGSASVVPDSSF